MEKAIYSIQGESVNRKATLLVLAFLLMATWRSAYAQGNEPPVPNPPSEGTYVLDTLDWLSSAQEDEANQIIQKLDQDRVAELFVITLDDYGSDKRNYRKAILQNWGVGHPNANNGLLILVCWYGGDASRRSVEQEFAPGLNSVLTGEITDQVAKEQFVPLFKNDHPGDGLLAMVVYYDALLRNPVETGQPSQVSQSPESTNNSSNPLTILVIGGFVVVFLIAYFRDLKNGTVGSNYYGGGYHDGGGGGGDSGSSTSF